MVLFLYLASLYYVGSTVVCRWSLKFPMLLTFIGSWLVGMGIGVPVTYVFAVVASQTQEPMLWGVLLFILTALIVYSFMRGKKLPIHDHLSIGDWAMVLFSLLFSAWLMMKTFHSGSADMLFVGSNNIFDFGHALGIVRSFSWGRNFPFASPFQAGLPFFYHFFFYFFVAIWEYFGVPVVWAMNIPSILSFASLLLIVYYLPQILFKQRALVGWIAVILTITHSTLAFWHLLILNGLNASFIRYIWRLPAYPYAGPFDGSVISIFMTLNNYVNQRHLAFGEAFGFFLILCVIKLFDDKRYTSAKNIGLGILTGLMFFWNVPICMMVGTIIALLLIVKRKWRELVIYFVSASVTAGVSLAPFIPFWRHVWALAMKFQGAQTGGVVNQLPGWSPLEYLWENLGVLPFGIVLGWLTILKKRRETVMPFLLLFIMLCTVAVYRKHGFDQKYLSFLIIGMNVVAARGIGWLLGYKKIGLRLLAPVFILVLTVSGVVDLMAVKNEFAFPFVDSQLSKVIVWIRDNTPKDAVYVSYADIIDPVALAGRKNYFGFFENIGAQNRSKNVAEIYGGNIALAKEENISYLLSPKFQKSDFPYTVHAEALQKIYRVVYEDERYIVFAR